MESSPHLTRVDRLTGFASGLAGFDDKVGRLAIGLPVGWCGRGASATVLLYTEK